MMNDFLRTRSLYSRAMIIDVFPIVVVFDGLERTLDGTDKNVVHTWYDLL